MQAPLSNSPSADRGRGMELGRAGLGLLENHSARLSKERCFTTGCNPRRIAPGWRLPGLSWAAVAIRPTLLAASREASPAAWTRLD